MRSIWSAVSGLDNHQTWMDAIGNNISNVNTAGYKDSRFEFQDILSQSLRGAGPPQAAGIGGTDVEQVGLGTTTGSIDTITTQGSMQQTNVPTDMAIQGNGYFVLSDGLNTHYSRDGVFQVDGAGNLVSSTNGLHLRGYAPNATLSGVQTNQLVNLTIPQSVNAANNTTFLDVFGNLDSSATAPVTQTVNVFDSLGQQHTISLTFTPNTGATGTGGTGGWTVGATSSDLATGAAITIGGNATAPLTFNGSGQLTAPNPAQLAVAFTANGNGNIWNISGTTTGSNSTQAAATLQLNDPAVGALTSYHASSAVSSQVVPANPGGAGNPAGFLKSFNIGTDGTIRGQYSTGFTAVLGQVALATFTNPGGLQRIGQNDWDVTSNSGAANVSAASSGAAGSIAQGSIETSNVSLGDELANVILAERGFQANSRMVTTSDQMLQDVIAMKQ